MIKPWRTLASRLLVQDQWLTVRADRVETGRAKVLDPYYVIERSDWVAIVPLTSDGQVVLTREYRHGAGIVADGLPGGVIEAGEGLFDAAARELREETGYSCGRWVELGALHANWRNQTGRLHVVLGLEAELTGAVSLDEGEDIEVRLAPWVDWLQTVAVPPAQAYYVAASLMAERWLARQGA